MILVWFLDMLSQKKENVIKHVGFNGQISLGKEFAGKQIQISRLNNNVLILKVGTFIPDDEKWINTKENSLKLEKAIQWAENTERKDNYQDIEARIENE
tara:strand:- start:1606 stop:1902 length:297 start_codon:yes stop_codon:yes gene_type:complete